MADLATTHLTAAASGPVAVPGSSDSSALVPVLHVVNGEHYAGAERVQDLLAAELPRQGFQVGLACVKPDQFPRVRQAQEVALYAVPMRSRCDLGCARRLSQLIRNHGYQLVHAHTPRSVFVGGLAAQRAGVPLIYHVHSPTANDSTRKLQNYINARIERYSMRHAARVITVSPSLKELMHAQGFADQRVTYVANGVPHSSLPQRAPPTGAWTLGTAALFRPRKGIEVLIGALAALRECGLPVRLRAVGSFETPQYEQEILRLVEKTGIGEVIDWIGFTRDIPAELQRMDLFVLPSLFGEGLPMVVLEAMAAGLPVVASAVEGLAVAIRHRQDGLLVEPGSASALAVAIEEMIQGDALDYQALSRSARARQIQCFSASAMAAQVAQVYREVLGN